MMKRCSYKARFDIKMETYDFKVSVLCRKAIWNKIERNYPSRRDLRHIQLHKKESSKGCHLARSKAWICCLSRARAKSSGICFVFRSCCRSSMPDPFFNSFIAYITGEDDKPNKQRLLPIKPLRVSTRIRFLGPQKLLAYFYLSPQV